MPNQRSTLRLCMCLFMLAASWAQQGDLLTTCSDTRSQREQERGCRPANASAGPLCSDRGKCICGVCECNDATEVISGPFCECDHFACDRNKGLMCSGLDHGECICGRCSCRPEYSGSACECLRDVAPCLPPDGGALCSGNGHCQCGQCVCNVNDGQHYSGKYCEKCPTCSDRCEEFRECVLCSVHHRGSEWNEKQSCAVPCAPPIQSLPIVVEGQLEANESKNEHLCRFQDDDDCIYVFVYSYERRPNLVIRAQEKRECPKKVANPIWTLYLTAGDVYSTLKNRSNVYSGK